MYLVDPRRGIPHRDGGCFKDGTVDFSVTRNQFDTNLIPLFELGRQKLWPRAVWNRQAIYDPLVLIVNRIAILIFALDVDL